MQPRFLDCKCTMLIHVHLSNWYISNLERRLLWGTILKALPSSEMGMISPFCSHWGSHLIAITFQIYWEWLGDCIIQVPQHSGMNLVRIHRHTDIWALQVVVNLIFAYYGRDTASLAFTFQSYCCYIFLI